MKIPYDYATFHKLIKFIHFDNTYGEPEADYFSITGSRLWKRDRQRLITMDLKNDFGTHYTYPAEQLEEVAYAETLNVDEKGCLIMEEEGKEKVVNPAMIFLQPESLKVFKATAFHLTYLLSSKSIVRALNEAHREQHEPYQEMMIDIKTNQFLFGPLHHVQKKMVCKEVSVNATHLGNIRYDYELIRQLLINAEDFTEWIQVQVFHPYFTVFSFHEDLQAVLMHKKE